MFALFTSRTGSLNGLPARTTSYLHKDHLGSVAAITTADGALAERLAYDPWGKRRHIHATPGRPDTRDAIVGVRTDRGYTEHEHLDEIGVIHMNGRIFDPLIGRFMSADAVIPDPFDLQSYNRYSYVENNPLALWDPSGHEPWSKGPDGGNTQYSSNSKGEVSNTFSGSSYSFSSSSLATKSSGVSPMSLAGLPGGGAQATSDYSKDTGKWTVTSFGKDLADSGATQKAPVGANTATSPKPNSVPAPDDHGGLDMNNRVNIAAATTAKPTVAQEAVSIVADVTPGVGTAKSLVQIYTGEDLARMALTLAGLHARVCEHVGEPGRAAPSTRGRVLAVVFAFWARYARADGRPYIGRSA